MSHTFTFTDKELAELVRAVEVHLDIADDTMFEDLDLYPSGDDVVVINQKKAKEIRDAISSQVNRLNVIRNLARKIGVVGVDAERNG